MDGLASILPAIGIHAEAIPPAIRKRWGIAPPRKLPVAVAARRLPISPTVVRYGVNKINTPKAKVGQVDVLGQSFLVKSADHAEKWTRRRTLRAADFARWSIRPGRSLWPWCFY